MSQVTSLNLQPLDKKLRNKLERTVKEARDVAESGALAALKQLEVGQAKIKSLTSDAEKDLRRRLRIHGRQLGDKRKASGEQERDRLVEEIAYEHWHRMLFARFLAENHLLMYPDPDEPVSVSLEDCEDMAVDEGAKNGWELAARFATKMLPQIFRVDSPVFELELPPEKQQRLESLLADLDDEVFTASDSMGWVYQFWQAEAKKRINESEVKIGARELPAVTQLFTEPYMVSFLLDNSLGAWWAAHRLSEEDLRKATSEQELREKAALPGVPLEYLRFVRTPSGSEGEGEESTGPWTPAAGAFDAWPGSLSELKTLDPCCGSGHFLVAALLMLTPMRMKLEGLSAREAVDCVLSENLHGLEIDQRCVELAAFALALAAWRFPDAGGYRVLPDLNLACCGLSVSVAKEEWKELAKDNNQLKIALDWMYDEFKDAPVLGSLLNPAKSMAARVVRWEDLAPLLETALEDKQDEAAKEATVVAHGLAKASLLLSSRYTWVVTNVPYKNIGDMVDEVADYANDYCPDGAVAFETVFLQRCLGYCNDGGICSLVLPQNWLFQHAYNSFRERILASKDWRLLARLGARAFETISGEVVKAILLLIRDQFVESFALDESRDIPFVALDVAALKTAEEKAEGLREHELLNLDQTVQLANPSAIVSFDSASTSERMSEHGDSIQGIKTGDDGRTRRNFWEVESHADQWAYYQSTVKSDCSFGGLEHIVYWADDGYGLARRQGMKAWGRSGVAVSQMSALPCATFLGEKYDSNMTALVTSEANATRALIAYGLSGELATEVRKIDASLKPSNGAFEKIPFDLDHWQQVAAEKYPHGLPEPYSDDPTQWIFHGHPASSTDALQVAVARLLGYRWPAELDAEMELATDARAWVKYSSQLTDLADDDGIVCIPAVGSEQPAEDRLLNLLHRAYEEGRAQEQVFHDKLDAADENDPVTVDLWRRGWQPSLPDSFPAWRDSLLEAAGHAGKTLESWIRDKFFTQHCKLFHHRPFIWHGLKDGFSVLINYHKLDNKLLKTLIYTYLNDWIKRQKQDQAAGVDGSEEKHAAAQWLKEQLEQILEGESPHDIFVRWKSLQEQPIGWSPDLNDGVRLNIRPWMTVADVKKRGAGLLRDKPNIKWTKDRGKDVKSAPWYHLGPEYGGKKGDRINDHHLTLAEKTSCTE